MKILQFCNKSPYPPIEGGPIAVNNITQGLIEAGHKVKVFAISTPKYKVDIKKVPEDYIDKTSFEFVYVDTRIKAFRAFLNLFSEKSYHIQRFVSEKVRNKLIEILRKEDFDIIQLESLYITPYLETIRQHSKAKVVLRAHNIEYMVWERLGRTTRNPFTRPYIRYLAKKLKAYELEHLNKYDGIATITRVDAVHFLKKGCTIPITDIPFGIDPEKYVNNESSPEGQCIFFIGAMNWIPNIEGIKWFLKNVWPRVVEKSSRLKLYIAGRNFPIWLRKTYFKNVIIYGEVRDAQEFMSSKGIMLAPLLSGSGIRVKIIEGMALGKTVISTTIGAEGINYSDGINILIANTPEDFVNRIIEFISNREKCAFIGNNARELVWTEHNNKVIIKNLELFYTKLISS
jgi:polysaccharide biosynthesis protein PslH